MTAMMVLAQITIGSLVISPEVAAVITSAVVSTISMYIALTKWLPGFLDKREQIWEKKQESALADEQAAREEDAEQRKAESEYRHAQIEQQKATISLTVQQIDINSKFAAAVSEISKNFAMLVTATRATEHAIAENTIQLVLNTETNKEFGDKWVQTFQYGSEPMRATHDLVEDIHEHGVKLNEAIRQQLDRIEKAVTEINDKVLPCEEAQSILANGNAILNEARLLIEMFNRDAQLEIEDRRKTDSKPIPPIVIDDAQKAAS